MKEDYSVDNFEVVRTQWEGTPAHYVLKITSYTELCNMLKNTNVCKYESDKFEAAGYEWKLLLYPEGNLKGNGQGHISLHLAIADASALPSGGSVSMIFRFFIYDQIRDNYLAIQDGKLRRYHALKTEYGFDQLLLLTAFKDSSNGYLVDDSCAFGVDIHVIESKCKMQKLSIVKSPICGSYVEKFKNFSSLNDCAYDSAEFTVGKRKWKLSLYPKGDSRQHGEYLSLFLNLTDPGEHSGQKVYTEFTLRVKDQINENHLEKTVHAWFDDAKSWGFPGFVKLSELHDMTKGFLKYDTIIVEVQFSVISCLEALP